jgi:hypothetical protein
MKSNNLQQIGENVRSQHRYWEGLSPDERRAEVIKLCNTQATTSRKNVVPMLMFGIIFVATSIIFWIWVFKMNFNATIGFAGGIILATIGFNILYANRINSYYKILSNNFDDNDVITYFREHEKINQRFLERWNKSGKYVLFVCFGIGIFLIYNPSTFAFAFVALAFGLGLFFVGAVFIVSPSRRAKSKR